MNVIFLACAYPPEMIQYTRGLAEVGARVLGVGDSPAHALPAELRPHLTDYLQVPRILDEADVVRRVHEWVRGKTIDRVLANWEVMVLTAARLREVLGVPGMSYDTVLGFRDKELMKERLRAAGVRVPRSHRVRSADELEPAVKDIGFPLIIKPIAGAGSADTYRVATVAQLEKVIDATRGVPEVSVEEYIEGEEFTYDTICIGGTPVYENVAHYLPKPLEARSNEWISPVIITVRDLDKPHLRKGIALGREVLAALRMGDGFTHMEWFHTPKGEVVFGEIGCRPGGAHLVDQMNYTSDVDLFREWARVVCWHAFEADATRRYNVGIVFKRALGQGRITRIEGLGKWLEAAGPWAVEEKLLRPGTQRRNWKNTLLSDGHVVVRHPDWDEAYRLSFAAATGIRMYAG